MVDYLEKYPIPIILLVCIGIFFCNLDVIYINIMEARNFVSAREMIYNGNWLFTTMNDAPRYEKPPLPTWLTALSAMLFGVHNLVALRLPAAIMALALIVTFYKFVLESYLNKKLAVYGALILATSFYIIFSGRNGQWDIFTHSFMVLSIYFLIKTLHYPSRQWLFALCSAVFFGCSFLSKGPVSLYALWLPFIIAYLVCHKIQLQRRQLLPFLLILIVGLSIGLSWYTYVRYQDPASFLKITQEETENWTNYNIRPFYYYWSFFTQSGIWTIPAFTALLYPYLKNKVSHKKAYTFSFVWTISAVVLLSFIPEKKSRYLLPVLIPMALNTALYIEYLILNFKYIKKIEKLPVYFNFGLIGFIGVLFPIAGFLFLKGKLHGLYLDFILCALLLFLIGLFILISLKKQQLRNVFLHTIAFTWIILVVGFPLTKSLYSNPEFNNINTLKTDVKLYSFGEISPEVIWHLEHSAPDLKHGKQIDFPKENRFGILTSPEFLTEFKRIFAKEYHMKKLNTYDINYTASPKQSAYKDRLLTYYFILEKKTR